ncbi:hypothetical protein HDU76_000650 [Blyttiomyces sp. JEL0837]|nr:hypothetical protein HDU76_000650 [Blyttiomyces sp. JEL0837]
MQYNNNNFQLPPHRRSTSSPSTPYNYSNNNKSIMSTSPTSATGSAGQPTQLHLRISTSQSTSSPTSTIIPQSTIHKSLQTQQEEDLIVPQSRQSPLSLPPTPALLKNRYFPGPEKRKVTTRFADDLDAGGEAGLDEGNTSDDAPLIRSALRKSQENVSHVSIIKKKKSQTAGTGTSTSTSNINISTSNKASADKDDGDSESSAWSDEYDATDKKKPQSSSTKDEPNTNINTQTPPLAPSTITTHVKLVGEKHTSTTSLEKANSVTRSTKNTSTSTTSLAQEESVLVPVPSAQVTVTPPTPTPTPQAQVPVTPRRASDDDEAQRQVKLYEAKLLEYKDRLRSMDAIVKERKVTIEDSERHMRNLREENEYLKRQVRDLRDSSQMNAAISRGGSEQNQNQKEVLQYKPCQTCTSYQEEAIKLRTLNKDLMEQVRDLEEQESRLTDTLNRLDKSIKLNNELNVKYQDLVEAKEVLEVDLVAWKREVERGREWGREYESMLDDYTQLSNFCFLLICANICDSFVSSTSVLTTLQKIVV